MRPGAWHGLRYDGGRETSTDGWTYRGSGTDGVPGSLANAFLLALPGYYNGLHAAVSMEGLRIDHSATLQVVLWMQERGDRLTQTSRPGGRLGWLGPGGLPEITGRGP